MLFNYHLTTLLLQILKQGIDGKEEGEPDMSNCLAACHVDC